MKIKLTKLPNSQVKLEVEIENIQAKEQVEKVIDRYSPQIEIKGFRKGFAPRPMVIDAVGIGRIQQEALESLVNLAYSQAIKEHKIYPLAEPSLRVKKFNLSPAGMVDGVVLLEMVLDTMPEVKLSDYTKIKVKDKSILNPDLDVTDAEVEKVILHLQRQKSTMEEVARPAQKSDWVEISFSGKIGGVAQEKLTSKNHPLVIGSGAMVPGFEEKIVGMEAGKTKKFNLTFPKNYFAREFAGKQAEFEVSLHAIKKINLPAVDLEFAKGFGHTDIAALKGAVKNQLEEEKKYISRQKLENEVLEQARKLLKAEIPPGLLHQETDRLIKRLRENVEKRGVSFDRYLESVKKASDDLHKELEPQAKQNIEIGLLLGEVIKREKLNPEDKEAPKLALAKLITYAIK